MYIITYYIHTINILYLKFLQFFRQLLLTFFISPYHSKIIYNLEVSISIFSDILSSYIRLNINIADMKKKIAKINEQQEINKK